MVSRSVAPDANLGIVRVFCHFGEAADETHNPNIYN